MKDDPHRFEMLLPFYLNGTLDSDDKKFVEHYLQHHPQAIQSLTFTKHLKDTLQNLVPEVVPATDRVNQIMDRWRHVNAQKSSVRPKTTTNWMKGFLLGLPGLSLVGTMVALVLIVSAIQLGWFKMGGHDGRPDIELVLASGVSPDHEVVLAQLKKFNAIILSHSEQDGYYSILVDLQRPELHPYPFIEYLKESGHLKDVKLIAAR